MDNQTIFEAAVAALTGLIWLVRLEGKAKSAHKAAEDADKRITSEMSRIDNQRHEDLAAVKEQRGETGRLLAAMDAKLDRLIERMLK